MVRVPTIRSVRERVLESGVVGSGMLESEVLENVDSLFFFSLDGIAARLEAVCMLGQ